ncbi:hypothetical protein CW745_06890 [Psychromonas sp. psych-6C06]|uniref:DUF481 domain-containing protein n=1 Tax=Psychromonas sp. psych-6C06 TaxID=2058089 RepID=UPI000C33533C|nr:DUF481 domain-containing protein [Psychromonas sp. psych-6C06]PKF63137.1 hypothetical protein CW745_06890 [Psychromonas sp. psych-6C06]
MANSGWFYILIVNIAVLSANVWLFTDKTQPELATESSSTNTQVTVSPQPTHIPTLFNIVLREENVLSSMDNFHFPFREPLPSREESLQSQLIYTQQQVENRNSAIKKEQQKNSRQSQQLASLKQKNADLKQALLIVDKELLAQETRLQQQRQKIETLQKTEKVLPLFQSDIQLVKKSIDKQPDLIKKKAPITERHTEHLIEQQTDIIVTETDNFSGSVEFGFAYEQDNQVTRSLNGRLILDYDEPEKYNINSDLDFEFENEDGEKSTDKYRWQLQSDYNLSPVNLVFARSDISRSQFSSYEREDIFTAGYGRIFFDTERHKFNVEIGPGYRFAKPNYGEDAVSVDEFIVRTRLNYERVLSDSLQVSMDTTLETGRENSVYNLNLKAQNRIYQELYLIFSFDFKYNQNVPIDTVNEEISSGLSLLYAF